MGTVHNEIQLLGIDLDLYETLTTKDCPSCHGGQNNDKAFTVTRLDEGLVYNCFRGTCGLSGFVPTRTRTPILTGEVVPKEPTFTPRIYSDPTVGLTAEQYVFLQNKYGLSMSELVTMRLKYNPNRRSFVFPIFNSEGGCVGVVDRSYSGRKPKSITYLEKDIPLMSFPYQFKLRDKGPIYLVEDQVSAVKVSRYGRAVSLLGCALSTRGVHLLMKLTNKIVFALDGDVTPHAIRLRKKYGACFKEISVLHLANDPKDTDDETLKGIFNR